MAAPKEAAEHALVVLAITCDVSGCCEWSATSAKRVRSGASLHGLTLDGVRRLLIDYVTAQGPETVIQMEETRPEHNDRPSYYKVIIPVEGLRHGLFVELILDDDDPELPTVQIVNCHEQLR